MRIAGLRMDVVVSLIFAASSLAFAQQPHLVNAQPEYRSAGAGLEREFRQILTAQATPAWIGYAVPLIAGEHRMCCDYSESSRGCGRCLLEGEGSFTKGTSAPNRVELESNGYLNVLYRIETSQVQKVRTFSSDCELDAGGLTLYWLNDVRPKESVALLASYVQASMNEDKPARRLNESALAAIAFHQDEAADQILEGFASPGHPESIRERTSFWLGVARGRRGYEVLRRMMRDDPSDHVRDKVVFALSQSHEPEAVGTMIEAAKGDRSVHVRGQALFWLAQKAGKRAGETITAAIENDPDTEVKKKAVFALSHLPADEGVPRLIQVARTHKNPAVKKQAMFWLGQSRDPRALSFFEEVLTR